MKIALDHRALLGTLVAVAAVCLSTGRQAPAAEPEIQVMRPAARASGRVAVMIELQDPPAAVAYSNVMRTAKGSRAAVQAEAAVATRAQVSRIDAAHRAVASELAARFQAEEIYRVSKAYNGIAVYADAGQLAALAAIPGVRAVHRIELEYPTTSSSVPFLGVPQLWDNSLGLGLNLTGAGIRIGIIDTGVDYLHPNFGGSGLLTAYQANDATTNADGYFPTSKVVGGTDFAGDGYTGSNAPAPDPDPMDCNGHGSHVAGIAAGYGVTTAGATFAGPYTPSAPFASLRIGPGVAPQAQVYALRVFGCTGGTNLTVQAINWAVDPNGDNDLSDHLDVINMSLGSNYGSLSSTSTAAAENAALAGVIVAAASGNAGDTTFITSAPANGSRTISVAASADSGIGGVNLQVNSPGAIAGNYTASSANSFAPTPAPAPTGQTASIVLALDPADGAGPLTTDGCSPLTNAAAVAGNIALVDRGTCGFQSKANNAQAAGAIGVIIANNVAGDPDNFPIMGATGTTPVTIPTIMISQADRNTIVANFPVNATLATVNAGDQMASFSSRGPRLAGSPVRLKPDVTAPGVNITSTQSGKTCVSGACLTPDASGFIAGGQALTISGTSMATPHIAGTMALLRQLHPDWSVEELKALLMNGALHESYLGAAQGGLRFPPERVGAGREDPQLSSRLGVTAFNADEAGLVSVSFDADVIGAATQVMNVRLVNRGAVAATYDLGIDLREDAPGVAFSFPGGSSVTVPAGGSVTFPVQMSATGNQMDHVRDATQAPGQTAPAPLTSLGTLSRHWLSAESGYIVFSQAGTPKLRVPVYMPSHPASSMSAPATIPTGGAPTGSTTIPLSGADVCTGTLGAGPACTGTFPTTQESLVTPFELQVVSPLDPAAAPDFADIQYGGVAYNGSVLMFGVSTWGKWSTPHDVAFNIYIDNNNDGTWDRVLFNSDPGTMAGSLFGTSGAVGQDTFLTSVFNLATNGVSTQQFINRISAAGVDSRLFDSRVMFLAATPASLGITGAFHYKIVTCPGSAPLCVALNGFKYDEAPGPYAFNHLAQGLNFSGANLADDLNGSTLPVTWNTANMTANGSLGALLLHHHNAAANQAQVVVLQGTPQTDLAISKSMMPVSPAFGQNVVFTVTVTNNGPAAATGVVVSDGLPAGLTYVSDDAGGAYVPGTGTWTVGSLAVSASATLHVTATVNTTDQACNVATITASVPLDANPANDSARVCVMAPRSADVALSMSVSSPTVAVGGTVTYTIQATNTGSDPAYSVNVTNTFPAFPGLVAGSFTASQGTYNPASGLWNLATLPKGGTATLDFTVTAPNTAGALTGNGSSVAGTADPNTANNTASATTTVLSPAAVTGTKTVSGSFLAGSPVTYQIVLLNAGSFAQQDNPGHEFTDVLPATLALVSATASSGTAVATLASNTVTWDGVIPAGGSVTITIVANIAASAASGTIVSNQGTISYDADGNGTNEASGLTGAPGGAGGAGPTTFSVGGALAAIPGLSGTGLAALAALLAAVGLLSLRGRLIG